MKSYEQQITTADKLLFPILSKEPKKVTDFAQFLKKLNTEGSSNGTKDWFPYPQLYPPGVLLHLRSNPYIGKIETEEMMEQVRYRFEGNAADPIIFNQAQVQLVSVEKEEFDHFSLEPSLMEDHRMGNYVWGLCRLFDEH